MMLRSGQKEIENIYVPTIFAGAYVHFFFLFFPFFFKAHAHSFKIAPKCEGYSRNHNICFDGRVLNLSE